MDATVVTALGPNPAPLVELVWALARQHDTRVVRAIVVVTAHGRDYLEAEVLAPGAALDQLHDALSPDVLPRSALEVREVLLPSGKPLEDDDASAEAAQAYAEAVWRAALDATSFDRPAVFALAAGRRRTMTAMVTTTCTLLARRRDRCVDVRVSHRAAEGGSGFFFPEQRERFLRTAAGTLDARTVEVELVDVPIPRLRRLLPDRAPASFLAALELGQRSIDAASPPELVFDCADGSVSADGVKLPISKGQFLWLATLASARIDDAAGEGWVASESTSEFIHLVRGLKTLPWLSAVRMTLVRHLVGDHVGSFDIEEDGLDSLNKLRADTRRKLESFARKHFPAHRSLLVPVADQVHDATGLVHRQRLALAPDLIRFEGLPPARLLANVI